MKTSLLPGTIAKLLLLAAVLSASQPLPGQNLVVEKVDKKLNYELQKLEEVYLKKQKELKQKAITELKTALKTMLLRQDLDSANAIDRRIKEIEQSMAIPSTASPETGVATTNTTNNPKQASAFNSIFGDKDDDLFKNQAQMEFLNDKCQWKTFQVGDPLTLIPSETFASVPKELKGRKIAYSGKNETIGKDGLLEKWIALRVDPGPLREKRG